MKFFQLGIIGSTGSGKSYFTKNMVNCMSEVKNRIIIIDDLNQFNFSYFSICYDLTEFIKSCIDRKKKIVLRFKNFDQYYDAFKILWLMENYYLVVDEISLFCSSYDIPEPVRNIVQRGRLKNICFIWNTQRANDISRKLSSQAEYVISFKLNEENDLRNFNIDRNKRSKIVLQEKFKYMFVRGTVDEFKKNMLQNKISLDFLKN